MPPENGSKVEINGHHLYVKNSGPQNGRPVILLHHGLGSAASWEEQIPTLAEAGFHVIAYDRWGYGRSDPRERFSMPFFEDDLQDLEALLEAYGTRPAALVGHSDGGTIALYYAAEKPERVSRLVTIAAHAYIDDKMPAGIEEVRASFEHKKRFQEGMRRMHPGKAEQVFYNWYHGWSKVEYRTWDIRNVLKEVKCPALVVQGWLDEHATPEHAYQIAQRISHAELWLVPDVGHMLPQDAPRTFNPKLAQFLASEIATQG